MFTESELEQKKHTNVLPTTSSPPTTDAIFDARNYSSLTRILRITAWVLRFVGKVRRQNNEPGPLTAQEMDRAEQYWILHEQRKGFSREVECINNQRKMPPDSPLKNVSLMMDSSGLLRVDGRLQRSQLDYNEKHPIVLPKESFLAKRVVVQCHRQVFHGGIRDTLAQVRERYWVVGARPLVKKTLKECITCQRFSSRPATQVTAPLPADRISEAAPFEVTGVDFAGPLLVRGATTTKCYIALFTCGVTRAVHLELVSDMSAASFLLAFRRFIARRGVPSTVYSDNALTFKKTSKDIAMLWAVIRNADVRSFIANTRVEWKFIVERAPWWGGFYERLVGLTKQALKKTLGTSYLSFEQLTTTLSEVEAILNSRPLTHVYTEPSEPDPLCPASFLTGKRLTSLPGLQRREIADVSCGHLRNMLSSRTQLLSNFWKRWTSEYLNELQSSKMHTGKTKELKSGDLVLLKESLQPRQLWKMGRVEKTFPGRDGKVRSCAVRVPGGSTFRRPIQVLYPLEMRD